MRSLSESVGTAVALTAMIAAGTGIFVGVAWAQETGPGATVGAERATPNADVGAEAGSMTHSHEAREAAEVELRNTEIAFAATMAARDHIAFASFLAPETVFFSGGGPLRGRDEVAGAWKRFFTEPEAPFSWTPTEVAVLDSGALGFTSGPVLNSAGEQIAIFNSVWRREPNGSWKIVFDRGCPSCPEEGPTQDR